VDKLRLLVKYSGLKIEFGCWKGVLNVVEQSRTVFRCAPAAEIPTKCPHLIPELSTGVLGYWQDFPRRVFADLAGEIDLTSACFGSGRTRVLIAKTGASARIL
jgi:hypothetical protein